jgi:nitrate reductase gamma subunit
MRAGYDQWSFVIAAYLVGIAATLLMTGWSWLAMRRAEARRARARSDRNDMT